MIPKWIQQVNRGAEAQAAERSDEEFKKASGESKFVDVAHEVLAKKAAEDKATLETLVRLGMPRVERERFKGKVRKKVWDIVKSNLNVADADFVEEITERIADVADADPYYKEMFEK